MLSGIDDGTVGYKPLSDAFTYTLCCTSDDAYLIMK